MSDSNPPEGNDQATEDSLTGGLIQPIEIQEEMERSFLDYAMTVITARALPDARDGLKPVHRRILYGMYDMGARPDRPHLKSARVVGDVMGKYHPHGSSAIYDALVRLAQDFSLRNPLIDGHGNFGSPDDPAAAERYCVTGDTLVRLADGTTIRIDEIVPHAAPSSDNPVDLKVAGHDGQAVVADMLFHSGDHPTVRVTTSSGRTLVGTTNHPVLCRVGGRLQWVLLGDITSGAVAAVWEGDDRTSAAPGDAILGDPGYNYEAVVSVEDAGVRPVYSLRIDNDIHAFIANGFVNHNTEARLDPLAMQMLAEIDEDTVDFNDNYSGEYQEPSVLPARFPNLLVNGSEGIAVGMATRIPPHNLGEIVDAVVHLVDNPDATPDDLMQFVKGPDFPTGGFILGRQGILDAYRTGRGSIRMRAKAEIDENKKGTFILVTEIPYQTSVGDIAVRIDELVRARELDGVADVNDESAKGKTKLVIKLKRDANANVVLNNLYKHTQLQTSYGVNMVALVDGVPRTLNLRDAIVAYVDHQIDVIRRRSEFRLKKAQDRLHIVEGLLKALDMIDLIVEKIRASADRPEARDGLMAAPFEFTEIQANYILDMTLSRLTRLGRSEYEDERAKLLEEIAELESILGDDVKLRQVIKDELGAIRAKFATPRRAEITYDPGDIGIEDLIDDEPLVVTMTKAGYIKTVAAGSFKVQGRGGRGIQGAKLKEEDLVTQIIHTTAHAYLLFFSNSGRVYRLRAHEVPMKERTAKGTAIVNLLPLQPGETIQAIIDTRDFEGERYLFFATRQGQVKKTLFSEYDKSRREGFIAINLKDGDELRRVITTSGSDDIFMVSRNGQTIRFSESEMRPTGRAAQGVIGMRLKADDEVVSCDVARDDVAILMITDAGFGKRTQLDKFPRKGRGTMGVKGIKLTARRGYVVAAFMVGLDDEIVLVSSGGVMNRQAVRDISSQGRDATGVRVMNLDAGQSVASAAPILASDDTE